MAMVSQASERIKWRCVALRRPVAVLCMLALVVVGFAHNMHHFDAAIPASASQIGVDRSGARPDPPNKDGIIVEHCLGCTMMAVVPSNHCDLSIHCGAETGVAKTAAVRSHALAIELPPPRSFDLRLSAALEMSGAN